MRIIMILLICLSFCCKNTNNVSSTKQKSQSAIVKSDDSLSLKEIKKESEEQGGITYSYVDKETNDFQELIIHWADKENFSFDIKMENDLCEYKDKGKAHLKKGNSYIVKNHSTLKLIEFNKDNTIVQLICEYGEIRDECDPIAEFQMIIKKN